MADKTFIIDCPRCRAKVAAIEAGRAENSGLDDFDEPDGERLYVGSCPRCRTLLAGESHAHVGMGDESGCPQDELLWSDIVRVFPDPSKTFRSFRIPRVVKDSLREAELSLQANANTAACVMLGRALEAVCRNILDGEWVRTWPPSKSSGKEHEAPKKKLMLATGIERLREKGHIDTRLFDWSQQLHAFRNLAAHPEDIVISREDAQDLQSFVYAIIEYIYDLADRYEEFQERNAKRRKGTAASVPHERGE